MSRNSFGYKVIFVLFFFSGLSALVHQVAWTRILEISFGVSAFAVATVLSSFMGGLALGSLLFGRLADKYKNPVRIFILLETGIGVYGLLIPPLAKLVTNVYAQSGGSPNLYVLNILRFVTCFLILVIPTTLMGGTLPVLFKFITKSPAYVGRNTGNLYSVNNFGAVTGCVLAGFYLIKTFGVNQTVVFSSAINFLIAAVSLIMLENKAMPVGAIDYKPAQAGGIEKLILLLFGIEGFISLVYEIVWIRILSASVLLNSVYSFTVVSATFITGLALGGFIISRFVDKLRNLPLVFVIMELLTGLAALVSLAAFKNSDYIISRLFSAAGGFWANCIGAEIVFSFIIMIIPAVLMGAIFPLVSRIYIADTEKTGSKIGLVGFYDTIGSVFGAFAAGFIFIQFFGLQSSVLLMAFLNLLIGITVLFLQENKKNALKFSVSSLSLLLYVLAGAFLFKNPLFWRKKSPSDELVFYKEDATATVTVTKRNTIEGETLFLRINGADVAGTDLMIQTTQKAQAHLPLLIYESINTHAASRILQVGLGSGGTSWSAMLHNPLEMTCVELVPGIITAAKKYFTEVNHNVFNKPFYDVVVEDGRNYLLRDHGTYDVILTESIHPIYAGNAALYSRDYFELCRKKLSGDGLLAVWLPVWKMSVEDFKTVLKTFQSVFPHSTLWYVTNCLNKQVHLIGTVKETAVETGAFIKNAQAQKTDLHSVNLDDPLKLMDSFLMSEDDLREYSGSAHINTEDLPVLEFSAPFSYDLDARTWRDNLIGLLKYKKNVYGFLGDSTNNPALEKMLKAYSDSSIRIIKGIIKHLDSDFIGSFYDFKKAALINPKDRAIPYLLDISGKLAVNQLVSVGNKYLAGKLFKKAVERYREALEINPGSPQALNALGTACFYMSSYSEAESIFSDIIKKYPNHPDAYNGLGKRGQTPLREGKAP